MQASTGETIRTEGGQRRFCVEELERVRDATNYAETVPPRPPRSVTHPRRLAPQDENHEPKVIAIPPWEARKAEAHADVEVTRARIERREEVRQYREAEAVREHTRRMEAEARAAEARHATDLEQRRASAQQALDECIRRVRMFLIFDAPEARAAVERFLAKHATPGASLPWIEAEVAPIRERHDAAKQAAARRERDDTERRQAESMKKANDEALKSLLQCHGVQHARSLTSDREEWDSEEAEEALEAVRDALTRELRPNWTERQVEHAVEEVVAEWD